MSVRVAFTVDGEPVRIEVEPDMPLLWALRDRLDNRGPQYSCGRGLCGACTVQLNGRMVRSCIVPVSRAGGSEVVTTEGVEDAVAEAVFQAWEKEDVPQCGYCQVGMIMGTIELLRRDPEPDDDAVDQAMSTYLCRCGTYPRIRRAIHRAASLLAST